MIRIVSFHFIDISDRLFKLASIVLSKLRTLTSVINPARTLCTSRIMLKDTVFIKNLAATAITGKDAWNRPTPQPVNISVSLKTDFHQASVTDNLKYSLNYAVISRNILEFMKTNEHRNFKSLSNLGEEVSNIVLDEKKGGGSEAEVIIHSSKSQIRADGVKYCMKRYRDGVIRELDEINVKGLKLLTIVGVFTFERLQRQIVDIDLNIKLLPHSSISIQDIIEELTDYVETSDFKTVEALVMKAGQLILQIHGSEIEKVTVNVTKPNAISFTDGVGVSSEMSSKSFSNLSPIKNIVHEKTTFSLPLSAEDTKFEQQGDHVAYIAFGSNEGNQIKNIHDALKLLNQKGIRVVSTSSMYISKPMYYKDQPDFYNGVVKVSFSDKSPHDLLRILKEIEYEHISRVKEFDNGPRSIDLDIILFDELAMNTETLIIPHKSMLDRTFVLQPLTELIPPDFIHPVSAEPIHNHLRQLLLSKSDSTLQESSDLLQIVPVPRLFGKNECNPLLFDQLNNKHSTLIMGILNITPDSFSDGGLNYHKPTEEILKTALELVNDGSQILDIGGVSTRPGSIEPSEEEEIARVVPVVKAIRNSENPALKDVLISVDTYRANVAAKCLEAGADIINDISMGLFDPRIFDIVAEYGCPYIVNHTRGTPNTMSKLTTYESNTNDDIIEYISDPLNGHQELLYPPEVNNLLLGVSRELGLQLFKAFERGVHKWQIILDPGIGFAKNLSQNLHILRYASTFKKYSIMVNENDHNTIKHSYLSFNGLPSLLGPSRKKFLGTITNEPDAKNRVISTAASVIACIEQKTDIVRVHDVKDIKQAVATGDAIYRDLYSK